jgi:hypothetical protein
MLKYLILILFSLNIFAQGPQFLSVNPKKIAMPKTSAPATDVARGQIYVGSDGNVHYVDTSGTNTILNANGSANPTLINFSQTGSTNTISLDYILKGWGYLPEYYGAVGDGVHDDADAIEAADAAAVASEVALTMTGGHFRTTPGKKYYCSRSITIRANHFSLGSQFLFPNDFTGIAINIGTPGAEAVTRKTFWMGTVSCTRTSYLNWDATPNSVGVQLNGGIKCYLYIDMIRNFAYGFKGFASGGYYCGYNNLYPGWFLDNKKGITWTQGDTNAQSWVNENTTFGGRVSQSSNFGTNVSGAYSFYVKQYATPAAFTDTMTLTLNQAAKTITGPGGFGTGTSRYYKGGNLVMSGWANSASNGTFRIESVTDTVITLPSNVTLGANETSRANVVLAMEGAPFGSIPNHNSCVNVSLESEVAEFLAVIQGGMNHDFNSCRFERASPTIMFNGMDANNAPASKNCIYGGYTNAAADFVLTHNTWGTQNSQYGVNRLALSSANVHGSVILMNSADITKPVLSILSVNNVGNAELMKPTTSGILAELGGYYLDMKPAASTVPKMRIGGSPGLIQWGDGSTALGNALILAGTNKGYSHASSIGTGNMNGGFGHNAIEATATLSGASTTITLNIPTGARLQGVQFRVDTLITSGTATSWSASFSGGSTTSLTSAQAFTKDTKANAMLAGTEITSGTTNIAITPNTGTFTAGVIRASVYYYTLETVSAAP